MKCVHNIINCFDNSKKVEKGGRGRARKIHEMEIFSIAMMYKSLPVSLSVYVYVCVLVFVFFSLFFLLPFFMSIFFISIHLQKSLFFPPIRLTFSLTFFFHFILFIQNMDRSNGYFLSWALWLFGMQTNFFVCKVSTFFSSSLHSSKPTRVKLAVLIFFFLFPPVNFEKEKIGANKY